MDTSFPELSEQAKHLLNRDFLYDDPASYRAGIQAMLALLEAEPARSSA